MDAFIPTHTIGQERVDLSVRQPVRGEELHDIVDVPPHDHSYYEVCIVWCGHARHITGEGCEALHAGSVVVIPPGGVHAFSECAGLRLTNL